MLTETSRLFYREWSRRDLGADASFIRDSGAYEWNDKARMFLLRNANRPRFDAGVLIEPASEPENADPLNIAGWTASGSPTEVAALSAIQGQVARKLTATASSSYKEETAGVFSAGTETVSAVVEAVPGALSTQARVVVRNTTAGSDVAVLNFNFATNTVTGPTGTLRLTRLLGLGPSGGRLYMARVTYSSTAGQGRAIRCFPDASGGNLAAVFHAAWIEENAWGSNPMAGTQLRDVLTYPAFPIGIAHAGRFRYIAGERSNMNMGSHRPVLVTGDGFSADSRFLIYQVNNADQVVVLFDDGTTERFRAVAATIAEGNEVTVTWHMASSGALHAQVRVGAGTTATGGGASATGGLGTAWGGSAPLIRIGHDAETVVNVARVQPLDLAIVHSADLIATTNEQAIAEELWRVRYTPEGRLLAA